MSRSKSADGAQPKATRAKKAPTPRKKTAEVAPAEAVTVRIIPAPAPVGSTLSLSPSEMAISARGIELAAEIDKALAAGELDAALDPAAVQALLAAMCRVYSRHVELGERYDAFAFSTVTPTDVMVTASGLLKAANLAVFELGMWQSWTGK
jgi:hypothetical protein